MPYKNSTCTESVCPWVGGLKSEKDTFSTFDLRLFWVLGDVAFSISCSSLGFCFFFFSWDDGTVVFHHRLR